MNRFICYSIVLLVTLGQSYGAAVEVSAKVDSTAAYPSKNEVKSFNPIRIQVTEPAWVTKLLGPTEPTEPTTTTKRPTLPERIRNTITTGIQTVGTTLQQIPTRINQLLMDATNRIRRPTTTSAPPKTPAEPAASAPPVAAPAASAATVPAVTVAAPTVAAPTTKTVVS